MRFKWWQASISVTVRCGGIYSSGSPEEVSASVCSNTDREYGFKRAVIKEPETGFLASFKVLKYWGRTGYDC